MTKTINHFISFFIHYNPIIITITFFLYLENLHFSVSWDTPHVEGHKFLFRRQQMHGMSFSFRCRCLLRFGVHQHTYKIKQVILLSLFLRNNHGADKQTELSLCLYKHKKRLTLNNLKKFVSLKKTKENYIVFLKSFFFLPFLFVCLFE